LAPFHHGGKGEFGRGKFSRNLEKYFRQKKGGGDFFSSCPISKMHPPPDILHDQGSTRVAQVFSEKSIFFHKSDFFPERQKMVFTGGKKLVDGCFCWLLKRMVLHLDNGEVKCKFVTLCKAQLNFFAKIFGALMILTFKSVESGGWQKRKSRLEYNL
jgi:hypothetical protein